MKIDRSMPWVEDSPVPDAMLYREDAYVLLIPGEPEAIVTPAELLAYLQTMLSSRQDDLPRDLQRFRSIEAQAESLMQDACEFELEPGRTMQWYVIRLEK